jgi:hypothetical protein
MQRTVARFSEESSAGTLGKMSQTKFLVLELRRIYVAEPGTVTIRRVSQEVTRTQALRVLF